MGLLDNVGQSFGNMTNDPRQMGLLMAAAQMMAQSGPSNRPVGLGEVMGGGLSTFLNTRNGMQQQQSDAAEREQAQQYRGVQMQGMQQQQDQVRQALAHAQALQAHLAKRDKGQGSMSQSMPPMGAEAVPQGQGMMPVSMGQSAPQIAPTGPQQAQESPYQRLMGMAEHLRSDPRFEAEASKYEERAIKFMPEVQRWQPVRVGDNIMLKPYFKDGSSGPPVDSAIAEKLEWRDSGGSYEGRGEYSGKVFAQQRKTQSPDSVASQFTQMRGQDLTDSRAREFNAIQQDANNIQRGEKRRTEDMTKASQVASFDTMLGTLDRLGDHRGLSRSVGVMSALPTMPGSDSANFQAELETFQSQAFIPMVAQLKGMGALSDAEGRKLTAAVGALNPSMSQDAFKQSIARIKADMEQARQRVTGSMGGSAPSSTKPRRYNPATGRIE